MSMIFERKMELMLANGSLADGRGASVFYSSVDMHLFGSSKSRRRRRRRRRSSSSRRRRRSSRSRSRNRRMVAAAVARAVGGMDLRACVENEKVYCCS
jgi:hypothetical protein